MLIKHNMRISLAVAAACLAALLALAFAQQMLVSSSLLSSAEQ